MKAVVIIVVIIAILGGGAAVLSKGSNKDSNTPAQTSAAVSTPTSSSTTPAASDQTTENTITYTDNGFTPATLTVKAGTKITVKNASSQPLQFDSDPHPEHTDDPEINIGSIDPGQSQTITVTKTGSHGYHNHLNADDTGTLVVE